MGYAAGRAHLAIDAVDQWLACDRPAGGSDVRRGRAGLLGSCAAGFIVEGARLHGRNTAFTPHHAANSSTMLVARGARCG